MATIPAYQFFDVSVSIAGVSQSLVQSVTVKGDAGLDFVSLPTTGTQLVYGKGRNIQVDIEYIHNGSFVSPTGCLLYNNFGDIVIGNESGIGITIKSGILIGTQSSIDAKDAFGKKVLSYMGLALIKGGSFSEPSPETGKVPTRVCFSELLPAQVSYQSSCSISRDFLYSPGRASPQYLCINYPIKTSSTITIVPSGITTISELSGIPTCPQSVALAANVGISKPYLESVNVEGIAIGSDVEKFSYNYTSTEDYGLQRILSIA